MTMTTAVAATTTVTASADANDDDDDNDDNDCDGESDSNAPEYLIFFSVIGQEIIFKHVPQFLFKFRKTSPAHKVF